MKKGSATQKLAPPTTTTAFSINPDPSLLYLTASLRAALHKCRFVIENYQGLTAIEGDVGLGKSTIYVIYIIPTARVRIVIQP
jgi:hypothetical protein